MKNTMYDYDAKHAKLAQLGTVLKAKLKKAAKHPNVTDEVLADLDRRHHAWLDRVIAVYTTQVANVQSVIDQMDETV